MDRSCAVIIEMKNERFFVRFGKKNRVVTAWSLLGATMFRSGSDELQAVIDRLKSKGQGGWIRNVTFWEQAGPEPQVF